MSSPSAEAPGEGAVQAFPSPVVGHLLFPDGHVGAIITDGGVERWERSSVVGIGGLVGLEVGLEGSAGPLVVHGNGN